MPIIPFVSDPMFADIPHVETDEEAFAIQRAVIRAVIDKCKATFAAQLADEQVPCLCNRED